MVPYRRANTELLLGAEVRDLSVLIPARNEMFLQRTVDDVLKYKQADTEIIVVLDGTAILIEVAP